ncbi:MAG: hypothetical protein EOP83_05870 [Verrucomicrobiaceae bacterium]|nr:MAG: hypothetical protein EOP83_05870 [Verrucomicrobiaceae bacterium]
MTTANAFDKATGTQQNVNNVPSFNAAAIDIVRGGVLRARWTVDGGGTTILQNGDNGDNFFYVQSNGQVWTKQLGDLNTRIEQRASDYANTRQANLGFTPVRQGGGAYQQNNTIYLGWDGTGLRAQVDSTDLGRVFVQGQTNGVLDIRLAFAGNVNGGYSVSPNYGEPYAGAVATGMMGSASGTMLGLRFRYLQKLDTYGNWYTCSYV